MKKLNSLYQKKVFCMNILRLKTASNMKDKSVRKSFLGFLKLNLAKLVCADQIHSNNVKIVNASDRDTFVGGCDGLITADKEIILGIFVVDCVPLLVS
jgi:copper oxidase (laccase) domain-containing protein